MPLVEAADISIGILTLIQPVCASSRTWRSGIPDRALRPLAGQGYGSSSSAGTTVRWLPRLLGAGRSLTIGSLPGRLTIARASAIGWILRATTALLLIGHGWFDFAMHKDWTAYAAAVGISRVTLAAHPLTPLAGWFECALGLLVLVWPMRGVLLFCVEARHRNLPSAGR
jgi:hypothetical protein